MPRDAAAGSAHHGRSSSSEDIEFRRGAEGATHFLAQRKRGWPPHFLTLGKPGWTLLTRETWVDPFAPGLSRPPDTNSLRRPGLARSASAPRRRAVRSNRPSRATSTSQKPRLSGPQPARGPRQSWRVPPLRGWQTSPFRDPIPFAFRRLAGTRCTHCVVLSRPGGSRSIAPGPMSA